MVTLIKANIHRMFKHIFFIPGLVLAAAITFLSMMLAVNVRHSDPYMVQYWHRLVALGIPAFFSLFTPLFVGSEYKNGAIRNKVMAGHSQSRIYTAELIAVVTGTFLMWLAWAGTGAAYILATGGAIGSYYITNSFMILGCSIFYSSIITAFAMRIRKMEIASVISMIFFMFSYFAGLTTFSINMMGDGSKPLAILENLFPLGQWFGIMNEDDAVPFYARIILAVLMAAVVTVVGKLRINKRQLT
ncbi:MAG: hypothetical protein K6F49_12350 [Saccharofermentans sp.]|nr:hypothetical protein [Saccharofermentans sp.]